MAERAAPGAAVVLCLAPDAHQQQSRGLDGDRFGQQQRLTRAPGEIPARQQCTNASAHGAVHGLCQATELPALKDANDQAIASLIGCFANKGFESHLINPC